MSFVKVSDVLVTASKHSIESGALEASYVVEVVEKRLGEVLGREYVGCVQVRSFKDGVLTLNVVSSVHAAAIRMQELRLLEKMNAVLENAEIVGIRYRVGELERS